MDKNAVKEIWKEHGGKIFRLPIGVLAKNVQTDNEHKFVTNEQVQKLEKEDRERAVEFSEASRRENINSGEKLGVLFGKIRKVIKDLGAAAWCGTTDSVTRGADGDVVTKKALKEVNEKTGGMALTRDGENIYVEYKDGADTVRKKLGNGVGILVEYLQRSQDRITGTDGPWGCMSVFDLSWIPGYQDLVFGENVFCTPVSADINQDGRGARPAAQLVMQFNFDSSMDTAYHPDRVNAGSIDKMVEIYGQLSTHTNRVKGLPVACHVSRELENQHAKAADLPGGRILQTSAYSQCVAYDPINGKLYYHVNGTSGYCIAVAIFKADIIKAKGVYSIDGSEEKYECIYAEPCW